MAAAGGTWSKGSFKASKSAQQVAASSVSTRRWDDALGSENNLVNINDAITSKPSAAFETMKKTMRTEWKPDLSPDEVNAIESWAGGALNWAYKKMNAYQRGEIDGSTLLDDGVTVAKKTQDLRTALAKAKTPVDMVTYRGATIAEIADWKEGDVRQTSSFMASTLDQGWAGFFARSVMLRVRVPKGTSAGLMESIIPTHVEAEILIPPGSTIHIRKITNQPGKKYTKIIDVDILP